MRGKDWVDSLFIGVNVRAICRMPACAPCRINTGISLYLCSRFEDSNSSCHLSATSSVSRQSLLHEIAVLCSMHEVSTAGTLMDVVPWLVLAPCQLVPVVAESLALSVHDAPVLRSHALRFVFTVPEWGKTASSNVVSLVTQADWTDRGSECFHGWGWLLKPAIGRSGSRWSRPQGSDPAWAPFTSLALTAIPLSVLVLCRVSSS